MTYQEKLPKLYSGGVIGNKTAPAARVQLSQSLCAVQSLKRNGPVTLGPLVQLQEGSTLEVCGDGYNDQTVMVRWNKNYFFVFKQDLDFQRDELS